MKIRWLGTAALEIKTGSTIILMDPWLSRFKKAYPPADINKEMIEKADYIFLTHGHFDHIEDCPFIIEKTGAKIHLSPQAGKCLIDKGVDETKIVAVKSGDKLQFDDFNVNVLKGKHIVFDLKTVLSKLFKGGTWKLLFSGKASGWKRGDVIGWDFELTAEKNKPKLTIFGSLGFDEDLFPEKEYNTDILIIPVAGRRDAWKSAIKYIEIFNPKIVIPTHYDNSFPPLSDWYMNQVENIGDILKEKHPNIKLLILELNKETEINP